MKALITGITGFAGSHLAEYILKNHKDWEVYGTKRYRSDMSNISNLVRDKVTWYHDIDYKDANAVDDLITIVEPDRIFHLSAESFVPTSWQSPMVVIDNNVRSQLNIFNAVVNSCKPECKIQIACSSEEYGLVLPTECPISEKNPLRPLSPYAVSKIAQDFMGYQYFKTSDLSVVRTRAFNHTGERRGHVFVCSTFAKQIAEIEAGLIESDTIFVGDLASVRDFTDVRDMVRAYWLALDYGKPGDVYNIGTGKGYTIHEVLNILLRNSKANIKVKRDMDRMRPSDVPRLICDSTKFRKQCHWRPMYELEETLVGLLRYWRDRT